MAHIKRILAGAILAICAQSHAQAGIEAPREFQAAGKTWLVLDETRGMSMLDFGQGVGGWNEKYRLANTTEITALLEAYGLQFGYSGWTPAASGEAGEVPRYMNEIGGIGMFSPFTVYQEGIGYGVRAATWFDGGEIPQDPIACPIYVPCALTDIVGGATYISYKTMDTGLFAVLREDGFVPEPSTLALFSIAGLLLARRHRKTQK